MKTREEIIEFDMNYCQHYNPQGLHKGCDAGMDIKTIQNIPTGERGIKWGPCIGGHTLDSPLKYCPKWLRTTREMAEKRADGIERSITMMDKVMPVVAKWRTWSENNKVSKQEIIQCPVCDGKLHLGQSAYNGHVWVKCETKDCVSWMQ